MRGHWYLTTACAIMGTPPLPPCPHPMRAQRCRVGTTAMVAFCLRQGSAHDIIGRVLQFRLKLSILMLWLLGCYDTCKAVAFLCCWLLQFLLLLLIGPMHASAALLQQLSLHATCRCSPALRRPPTCLRDLPVPPLLCFLICVPCAVCVRLKGHGHLTCTAARINSSYTVDRVL